MIKNSTIESAAYEIMKKAAIDIPEDYLEGIKNAHAQEKKSIVRLRSQINAG